MQGTFALKSLLQRSKRDKYVLGSGATFVPTAANVALGA